ncbi:MAG: cytochrome c [Halothiobacillaceae bacterium]
MNNTHIKTVVGGVVFAVAIMASPLFAAGHDAAVAAPKGPSSNVAWTAEMVRFVAQGDKNRGGQLNQELFCASCHGNAGISHSYNWPSLAGQRAEYTFKMLKDYKDGKLKDTQAGKIMSIEAQLMTEQDMADLAQFYASFPLPPLPEGVSFDVKLAEQARPLVTRGDGKRLLAPCQSCHSSNGSGAETDTPALAGQPPEYFIKTMQEYKNGTRHNDIYARMRLIAKVLTDEEIVQLAHYYAGLTAK